MRTTILNDCDAEINTILAALRFYQHSGFGDPEIRPMWIQVIACPDIDDTSLDDAGIDALCEQLKTTTTFVRKAPSKGQPHGK